MFPNTREEIFHTLDTFIFKKSTIYFDEFLKNIALRNCELQNSTDTRFKFCGAIYNIRPKRSMTPGLVQNNLHESLHSEFISYLNQKKQNKIRRDFIAFYLQDVLYQTIDIPKLKAVLPSCLHECLDSYPWGTYDYPKSPAMTAHFIKQINSKHHKAVKYINEQCGLNLIYI